VCWSSSEISGLGGSINSTLTTLRVEMMPLKNSIEASCPSHRGRTADNAMITKVTLKFKLQAVTGERNRSPCSRIHDRYQEGHPGTAVLQTTDFQAVANKTIVLS